MTVGTIIALVVAIPIILIPLALVWYINVGGIALAIKEAREKIAFEHKATTKA